MGISLMKVNDNVNENDYYKDEIIFETLAGSQAVRNLRIPEEIGRAHV